MKKPPAVAVVLLVLCQLGIPARSGACPIVITLWDLIERSDLIVVARVTSVSRIVPRRPGAGTEQREWAALEVIDTWKGRAPRELRVDFLGDAPNRYSEGDVVVAFLQSGDSLIRGLHELDTPVETPLTLGAVETDSGVDPGGSVEAEPVDDSISYEVEVDGDSSRSEWTPDEEAAALAEAEAEQRRFEEWAVGRWIDADLSSGIVRGDDPDEVGEIVRAALRLQSSPPVSANDRIDWILSAAELPALRSEMVFELSAMRAALTDRQARRLASLWVAAPAVDATDAMVLDLLAHYPDSSIDLAAASVIEAGLRMKPIPSWTTELVVSALARYGDDMWERVGRDDRDNAGHLIYMDGSDDTLPTIWAAARRDLGIPEVPPAEPPASPPPAEDPRAVD